MSLVQYMIKSGGRIAKSLVPSQGMQLRKLPNVVYIILGNMIEFYFLYKIISINYITVQCFIALSWSTI